MLKKVVLLLLIFCFSLSAAAQEEVMPEAGDERVDEFGIEQVYVPAGCFRMGTSEAEAAYARTLEAPDWSLNRLPSEQPQHEVCLTQGYWIDQYEVTNAAYQAFIDAGGYTNEDYWTEEGWAWVSRRNIEFLPTRCITPEDEHPRVCVTWYEADAYARWRGGSLPTEAQWEYAARGPESTIYPWGNAWDAARANVLDTDALMPVGSYPDGVSWVGAHDMAGNAMEWVSDWLADDYSEVTETDDPTGPEEGTVKIEKGGWWGSNPVVTRSAYRHFEDPPTYQDHHIGFRVVSPAQEPE